MVRGLTSGMERSLPVHPIQLYDAMHSFIIFIFLWWHLRKDPPEGVILFQFVLMYGAGRFVLEMVRGDHSLTPTGLTISQNVSLLMVLGGAIGIIAMSLRSKRVVKPCA